MTQHVKNVGIDQESVLSETLSLLYDTLKSIELHGEGEHGSTIGDVARVSTAIIAACAERRQQQRDRKRALEQYDDDELVAYIKALPERRREAFAGALSGIDPADIPIYERS